MDRKLTIREQKRIESDNRILKATISLIGKKGYTASSIRDIAKAAGVNSGLIMQRFESKEGLVIKALSVTSKMWSDVYISDEMSAYEMLTRVVFDAKQILEKDEESFNFIYTMCSSADIPETVYKVQRGIFFEKGIYRTLKKAQDDGNLPKGDLEVLYGIFVSNALHLIRDYKSAGLKMPEDEKFLVLIQYKDSKEEDYS